MNKVHGRESASIRLAKFPSVRSLTVDACVVTTESGSEAANSLPANLNTTSPVANASGQMLSAKQ